MHYIFQYTQLKTSSASENPPLEDSSFPSNEKHIGILILLMTPRSSSALHPIQKLE